MVTHILLESLNIDNNEFVGGVPKEIGGLLAIEYLSMQNNNLKGSIPTELNSLRKLSECESDELCSRHWADTESKKR